MTLTKAQLVNTVAEQLQLPKNKSSQVIEGLIEIIKRTLSSGEDVLISGFGKFCVKQKRARRGRNPATGEDLVLAERKVVTFKCSGKLREKINSGEQRQRPPAAPRDTLPSDLGTMVQ